MKLRTLARDSLFLAWALPAAAVPPLPEPLRPEVRTWRDEPWVFASVALSHQEGLRVPAVPFLSLTYSQLNLFLYVFDGDDQPAVYVHRVLVPAWLGAGMRLVTGLPVDAASFETPSPSEDPEREVWRWRVKAEGELVVNARRGGPLIGEGPRFPSWGSLVRALRDRAVTYMRVGDGLRRIEVEVTAREPWPLVAEVEDASLLTRLLPLKDHTPWPAPYAAWLDPELPLVLSLTPERGSTVEGSRVPAPG